MAHTLSLSSVDRLQENAQDFWFGAFAALESTQGLAWAKFWANDSVSEVEAWASPLITESDRVKVFEASMKVKAASLFS